MVISKGNQGLPWAGSTPFPNFMLVLFLLSFIYLRFNPMEMVSFPHTFNISPSQWEQIALAFAPTAPSAWKHSPTHFFVDLSTTHPSKRT